MSDSQESAEHKEVLTTGPPYRHLSSSNQYLTTTSSSESTMPSSSSNTHIIERQINGAPIDPMKKYYMTLDEFFNVVGKNASSQNKKNENDPDGLSNNTKINQLDKIDYENLLENHRLEIRDDERIKILQRRYSYSPTKYEDNNTRQNHSNNEMPDIKVRKTYNGYETIGNGTTSSSDVPPLIPRKYPRENLRNHDEPEQYDERLESYKSRRPSSHSPPRNSPYTNDVEQMQSRDVYKHDQPVRYIEIRNSYSPFEVHESMDYNKHDNITRQHDNSDEIERHHKYKNRHLVENPTSSATGVAKYNHVKNQRPPATMCLKTGAVSMPVPTLIKYNSHENPNYPPRLISRGNSEDVNEETLRKNENEDAIDIDGEDDASFGSSATSDELNHKEVQYPNVNSSSTEPPYYKPDGTLVQPSHVVIEKKKRGGGKLGRKRRRGYIYDPKPLVRKSKPNRVPTATKDPEYWDKRQRNNEAAKRSRENRRQKELEIVDKAKNLHEENESLQNRIKELEAKNSYLEQLLSSKNSSCHEGCGQKKFT